jgi:hypothetical protein
MTNNTDTKTTAQVACESIINMGDGVFDIETMTQVLAVARREGVASIYTDDVEAMIDRAVTRRDDAGML